MANEWNLSYPIDHTLISAVPEEIRKLKTSAKAQLDMEHETPVDGDATGSEHSSGSAVAYEGTTTPTNRPDGATALADNAIDRGRIWLDDNYDPPTLKRWSGSAFELVAGTFLSAYTKQDSEGNLMLKGHAYKAATPGWVTAYVQMTAYTDSLRIYVGLTDDPEGAGNLIQIVEPRAQVVASHHVDVCAWVAKDEYFEITANTGTPTIWWKSFGTLSKPVDQEA